MTTTLRVRVRVATVIIVLGQKSLICLTAMAIVNTVWAMTVIIMTVIAHTVLTLLFPSEPFFPTCHRLLPLRLLLGQLGGLCLDLLECRVSGV